MSTLKFVSNAPKCKSCTKTAYPQESITYDNMTWHKACFRCLNCKGVVALKQVAVIRGDLYCKACFMRMFAIKGTYSVFSEKKTEKAEENSSADTNAASTTTSASNENTNTPVTTAVAVTTSSTSETTPTTTVTEVPKIATTIIETPTQDRTKARIDRRMSLAKKCNSPNCTNLRVHQNLYCEEHLNTPAPSENPHLNALLTAISQRSVVDVKHILDEQGVDLALDQSQKQSPLEIAFTSGSISCGQAMVEALSKRLNVLEEELDKLEDEVEEAETKATFILMDSSPRNSSADVTGPPKLKSTDSNSSATANTETEI